MVTSWHHNQDAPKWVVALGELEELGVRRLELLSDLTQRFGLHQVLSFCGQQDEAQALGHDNQRLALLQSVRARAAWLVQPKLQVQVPGTDRDCVIKEDNVSHYALRLAFCGCESDEIEWFVQAEALLLALQWVYLRDNADDGSQVVHWLMELAQVEYAKAIMEHEHSTPRFLVPFQHATELVRTRHVCIRNGMCLVPQQQMIWVALYHFRMQLRNALTSLRRARPMHTLELAQLQPVVNQLISVARELHQQTHGLGSSLHRQSKRRKHGGSPVVVSLETIDALANSRAFPLCMQQLHTQLRANHHLKYDGRVQYRLFLKGLGFSVQQNMFFWRNEFTKSMTNQKFDKEYAYNIRHSYGLEGSRKDYAPQDCQQIRKQSALRKGQFHGCPFRHWDTTSLSQELRKRAAAAAAFPSDSDTGAALHEVIQLAQQNHPEEACRAYFRVLHGCSKSTELRGVGKHPLAWFEETTSL